MDRLPLFPDTTTTIDDELVIGGCRLTALAEAYDTPLYVYDRATLDHSVRDYRELLGLYYPHRSAITYAGKAYLCAAMATWAHGQSLTVDCSGQGEVAFALAAGLPREAILVHGVNKSAGELRAAARRAGTIVADSLSEVRRLAVLGQEMPLPEIWLRFQPGLAVETHAHTHTGQAGSKFGMELGTLVEAARMCREAGMRLRGLHVHQGSQFSDPGPLVEGIQRAMEAAKQVGFPEGWHFSPGGGWGVAYHEDELPPPALETYVRSACEAVLRACEAGGMPPPMLHLEPGRSLAARAGVAVYRVGTVKESAGRTWLLVDGGMADNPRPALYGVRYSALPVRGPERPSMGNVSIGGPLCESGDVLIEDLPFPETREGELIAVPMSGAYQLSMSSNYNGSLRPAVVIVINGVAGLMQRRETMEDLLNREISPSVPRS